MWLRRPRSDSIASPSGTSSGTTTPRPDDSKLELLFPRTPSLTTPIEASSTSPLANGAANLIPGGPAQLRRVPSEPRRKPRFGKILARSPTHPEASTTTDHGDDERDPRPRQSRSFSLPHVSPPDVAPSSSANGALTQDQSGGPLERPRSASASGTIGGRLANEIAHENGPEETSISVQPSGKDHDGVPAESNASTSTTRATTTPPPNIPLRVTPSRRWFPILPRTNSLFPFESSHAHSQSHGAGHHQTKVKRKRKGDMECLSYGTLDDESMARLRGKSDHRPIVGVYSICVG